MATPQREITETDAKWFRRRVRCIGAAFALGFGILVWRAVQLQVVQSGELTAGARDQYVRQFEIPGQRGRILDRQNREFAASVDVDSIAIDPTLLKSSAQIEEEEAQKKRRAEERGKAYKAPSGDIVYERGEATRRLAKALGLPEKRVASLLDTRKRFVWLKRQASPQETAAIKATNVAGLTFQKVSKRFYPQRELGAHVIGYSNIDGRGIEGLERVFDDVLKGRHDYVSGVRDRRGRAALMDGTVQADKLTGATLTLTLDSSIQHLTEKALASAVEKSQAAAGMAVVLDPHTGEILALANWPTFNPNSPTTSDNRSRRNRAVVDQMEQGSTLKPITVAAALEEKVVRPDTVFDGEKGAMRIGRHTIHDSHPHDSMTVAEIIKYSSNIGVAKIAQLLGRDKLQSYLKAFGFAEKPGTEMPGEAKGSVPYPRAEIALATQSFGQGMSASILQTAVAYGALANGGRLMKPYLVSRIVDAEGKLLLDRKPQLLRRVVSEKTAREVIDMMELVVEKGGTGTRAYMDDYAVAAKSGTAQKVDPNGGYSKTKRIASFAGIVPADAPRLVIAVTLDEPSTNVYGGVVAAPPFKEIARGALVHLGIPPRAKPAEQQDDGTEVPLIGRGGRMAVVSRARLAGAFAMAQQVSSGDEDEGFVEEEGVVASSDAVREGMIRVPGVCGLTARAAARALLEADLDPVMNGFGLVVEQTPPVGASVRRGTTVSMRLK